jgi:hypothetical protein
MIWLGKQYFSFTDMFTTLLKRITFLEMITTTTDVFLRSNRLRDALTTEK